MQRCIIYENRQIIGGHRGENHGLHGVQLTTVITTSPRHDFRHVREPVGVSTVLTHGIGVCSDTYRRTATLSTPTGLPGRLLRTRDSSPAGCEALTANAGELMYHRCAKSSFGIITRIPIGLGPDTVGDNHYV
jgi:hypothetical protein